MYARLLATLRLPSIVTSLAPRIQKEREERHKKVGSKKDASGRSDLLSDGVKLGTRHVLSPYASLPHSLPPSADDYRLPGSGSFDTGDPNTTNIYLGNINPKVS